MAHVLELYPPTDDRPSEAPSQRRIRQASRALSLLFGAMLVAEIVFGAGLGLAFVVPIAGDHLLIGPKGMLLNLWFGPSIHAPGPAGYLPVEGLPAVQRLAHVAMGFVVFIPSLMIFWNLRALFRLYGRGVVFAAENARLIKHIGVWLVLTALGPLVSVSVLTALHMVVDHAWFHGDTIPKIVLGAVVYVVGMVMEVGREIEEEQGQFV